MVLSFFSKKINTFICHLTPSYTLHLKYYHINHTVRTLVIIYPKKKNAYFSN